MGQTDLSSTQNSTIQHVENESHLHELDENSHDETKIVDKVIDTLPYTALILGVAGAIFLVLLVVKLMIKRRKLNSKAGKMEENGHDNPGLVIETQPPTYEETIEGRESIGARIFGSVHGSEVGNSGETSGATLTNVTWVQSERF